MSNCRGCGSVLDPTDQEVNQAVDEVLVASLKDTNKHGEICPLCGHSKAQPISHRIQFGLLLLALVVASGLTFVYYRHRDTERQAVAHEALEQIASNPQIAELIGTPLSVQGRITGDVRQDETRWQEVKLTIPIHGPKADGSVRISGLRENGGWKFTTLEVVVPQLQKNADLITGRIVEYRPNAYLQAHTEAAAIPQYVLADVPRPRWDRNFPCVYMEARVPAQHPHRKLHYTSSNVADEHDTGRSF